MPKILNNIVNNLNEREILFNNLNPKFKNYEIMKSYFYKSNYLYKYNITYHKQSVNSIKFSDCGKFMASGGDDLCVCFFSVEKCFLKNYRPQKMKMKHRENIFSVNLNYDSTKVFSGGNCAELIVHDTSTGNLFTSRLLETSICDISINPFNTNITSIGCEDDIAFFDLRANSSPVYLGDNIFNKHSYKTIEYSPIKENLLLVASNCKKDVCLIDLRNRKIVFEYKAPFTAFRASASCARYNRNGDKIIVTRNRLPVSLYSSTNSNALYEFDSYGYYNSITQKNICFCGDEYIACPSDDFNIYLYKVPEFIDYSIENLELKLINRPDFVLYGHLSIVNNVSYNYNRSILASSSVENCIKFWSPFPLNLTDEANDDNLSTSYVGRQICPHSSLTSSIIFDSSDNESNSSNVNTATINFFDNLIRYNFRDEDNEEFLKIQNEDQLNENKFIDLEFNHNLKYFKALINDFEMNGKKLNNYQLDKFKEEKTRIEKQSKYVLTSKSIEFLFNCKKIKQFKLIIERCFKLVQNRIRFLRNSKRSSINNDDLIEEIKLLKNILINLKKLYNNKRALEIKLSPTKKELLIRLTKIFFRGSLRSRLVSSSSSDLSDNESNNELLQPLYNGLRIDNLSPLTNDTDDHSEYISLSDDESLSTGSVLDESSEDNKNNQTIKENKSIKRKKMFKTKFKRLRKSDNAIDIHLLSSNTESGNSDDSPILKMRKSSNKSLKAKNYNFFAFDSEIDCSTNSSTTSIDNNEMIPNCSFNTETLNNNLLTDSDDEKQSDKDKF